MPEPTTTTAAAGTQGTNVDTIHTTKNIHTTRTLRLESHKPESKLQNTQPTPKPKSRHELDARIHYALLKQHTPTPPNTQQSED